ncbi:MAG: mechanosensitive ion channel family protein [Actinomycetia bacterium]|nr:mechanosensitive ion channel family protein [Actinomycetes bacterium]
MTDDNRKGHPWAWMALVLAVILALAVALNQQQGLITRLPLPLRDPLKAAAVWLIGSALSVVLERYVFNRAALHWGRRQLTTLRFLLRLVLYVAVALAVLAAFGVGVSSVVFGGAFLTVIVGLAGQTLFQNLLAGVWLVLFHPFEVGDEIELVAWQYPLLMPSYPHEAMRPAYVGTVADINLMYTALRLESGLFMTVPNGVVVQAAVTNRTRSGAHRIRCRFDVPRAVPAARLLPQLECELAALVGPEAPAPAVWLADFGPTTYSVVMVVTHHGPDEAVRHRMLVAALDCVARYETAEGRAPA